MLIWLKHKDRFFEGNPSLLDCLSQTYHLNVRSIDLLYNRT